MQKLNLLPLICFLLFAGVSTAYSQDQKSGAHVDLPGVKLWYTDTGGNGVPVVLLHANTGTSAEWQDQSDALSKAGFRVIAFDRRGWGKSMAEPSTGQQPGTVTDDLTALADQLHLDPFHLVGIAGGGFVAIDYAAWKPEKVRSLTIVASNGQIREDEILDFTKRIDMPSLRDDPKLRVFRELGVAYRAANPEGTERFIEVEHNAKQKDAPSQPMRTPNDFAKLAKITAPSLILAGGADLISPPALMKAWARHIPRYEFHVIDNAGHSIAWEQPGKLNDHLVNFISQN